MPEVLFKDTAAVIVLYRPGIGAVDNVGSIAAQVDHAFAVDNTEDPDLAFVEALRAIPNLTYVALGDNLGIATALNRGIEIARDAGYSWALTMDQDSTPDTDMVATLAGCVGSCATPLPIGIVAPLQLREGGPKPKRRHGCAAAFTVMTSGDLLSIDAWEAVGRFDEGLFIDRVDHDICLRMHRSGFAVMRCRDARLRHRLGETVKHRFPVTSYVTNHSALRRYYITRNRLEVSRRFRDDFPEYRRHEMHTLRRDTVKIVLYEDHKAAKLLMSWRGYLDYRRGVTGRYAR